MKKNIAVILAAVIVLLSLLCGCGPDIAHNNEVIIKDNKIKLGLLLPFSGDMSVTGKMIDIGIEYAHKLAPTVKISDEIEIELIEKDYSSDAENIKTAASELIESGIGAVICDGLTIEVAKEAVDAFSGTGIPLVLIGSFCEGYIDGKENVFCVGAGFEYQSSAVASYSVNEGLHTAAVICDGSDSYYTGFADSFVSAFKAYGGSSCDKYALTDTDFSANTVVDKNYDLVFVACEQSRIKDINGILLSAGVSSRVVFSQVYDKSAVSSTISDNVYVVSNFDFDDENYVGSDFINSFRNFSSVSRDSIQPAHAYGYDAYLTVYEALRSFSGDSLSLFTSDKPSSAEAVSPESITGAQLLSAISDTVFYGATDTISFTSGIVNSTFLYIDYVSNSTAVLHKKINFSKK